MAIIEVKINLEALESKDIVITLGADTNFLNLQDMAYKYTNVNNALSLFETNKNIGKAYLEI